MAAIFTANAPRYKPATFRSRRSRKNAQKKVTSGETKMQNKLTTSCTNRGIDWRKLFNTRILNT